ncbi:hypothetical protein [Mycoplasma tauri]|uniref:hypothetical protein n=2 Tax=Mycoplasma tauri TaxID=547987 RepID=UPI001967C41A|nr:hypothetical protein [Mycoplasma tauri]MBZ4204348.1 hypothetical protein [Mycoplasma tauri]QSB07347.1 hypothetical protein JS510_02435 [Mycoplasma tauri]
MQKTNILLININDLEYFPTHKNKLLVHQYAGAFKYFEKMCPNVQINNDCFILEDLKQFLNSNDSLVVSNKDESRNTIFKNIKLLVFNTNEWFEKMNKLKFLKYSKISYKFILANFYFNNNVEKIEESFNDLDYFFHEFIEKQEYQKHKFLLLIIVNSKNSNKTWFIGLNKKEELNFKTKNEVINYINKIYRK